MVFWCGRATLKRAIAHVSKPHHTSMDELHRRVGLDCHECLLRARTRFLDSVWRRIKEQHISISVPLSGLYISITRIFLILSHHQPTTTIHPSPPPLPLHTRGLTQIGTHTGLSDHRSWRFSSSTCKVALRATNTHTQILASLDLNAYGTPLHTLLTQTRLVWNTFRNKRLISSHKVL